jgi:hypothetical protein
LFYAKGVKEKNLWAIEKGNEGAMCNLKYYYEDNILGLYDLLVSSENRNKFINDELNDLHLRHGKLIIYYNKKMMQMKHDICID